MSSLIRRRNLGTSKCRVRFFIKGILIKTEYVSKGGSTEPPEQTSVFDGNYEYICEWNQEDCKNIMSSTDINGIMIKERLWLWNPDNVTQSKTNWISGDNTEAAHVASGSFIFGKGTWTSSSHVATTGTTPNYKIGTDTTYPNSMRASVQGATNSATITGGTSASYRNGRACRTKNLIDMTPWDTFNFESMYSADSGSSNSDDYFKAIYCVFDSDNKITQLETGDWRGYCSNDSVKTFTLSDGTTKICRPGQIVNRAKSAVSATAFNKSYDVSGLTESAYVTFVTIIKAMSITVNHNISKVYFEKVY